MSDHQKMAEDLSKECRKLVGQIIIKHDHAIIEQLHSEVGAYKAKIATLEEWFEDLKAQLKEREWISVEDILPQERCLAYTPNDQDIGIQWRIIPARLFEMVASDATHWMPLPSPPITEKES